MSQPCVTKCYPMSYNEGTDNQNPWNIMVNSRNRWEKLMKSNDSMPFLFNCGIPHLFGFKAPRFHHSRVSPGGGSFDFQGQLIKQNWHRYFSYLIQLNHAFLRKRFLEGLWWGDPEQTYDTWNGALPKHPSPDHCSIYWTQFETPS